MKALAAYLMQHPTKIVSCIQDFFNWDKKEIVRNIREIECLLGKENLERPLEVEKPAHRLARRSIVARENIERGKTIKDG